MNQKKYDAVIIGAGNSGIAAALRLRKEGKKTLLIEKHNLPGGCSTSFVRGRFEFDATLHEFCNWGPDDNKGDSRLLLEELGIQNEWIEIPECYRLILDKDSEGNKMDVRMPSGLTEYINAVEKEVSGSKKSLKKLFALIEEMQEATEYINHCGGKADSAYLKKNYPDFLRCAAYSTKKVFDSLNIPSRAQDILATYWTYLGQPLDTMAFLHYGLGIYQYISRGPYIPVLTSHCNSVDLMTRYYEAGGEAWFHTNVEQILVENGCVTGVRTTNGFVKTDTVIGNLNPHMVFGKMIEDSCVPEREKKLASQRKFGFRFFNLYLGLNKTAEELGLEDYSVFISKNADTREIYNEMKSLETNDYVIFNCYNVANPQCSPEGTSICTLTAMFSEDAWKNIKMEDYQKEKEAYASRLISIVEDHLDIKISDAIEEMEIATPVTFARYLGTPEGTAYGYETNLWDSMMARLMSMSNDHTIDGLYLAGAAGVRGHGNNIGYMAGDTMAKMALKSMKQERR